MEIKQLQSLVAIADHGTFSAAAKALDTVQSNVSAHIGRLEKELGTSLIDRSTGVLTDEGDMVAIRARRILHEMEDIDADIHSLGSSTTGTKAMICYNVDYDTVDELVKRDYTILAFKKNDQEKRFEYKPQFSIVVERFYHLWYFLKQLKGQYRYIITTDVKDVIFQSNPSTWLENNIKDKKINVACESIRYKDEDWGNNNLLKSFGQLIHDHNKDNLI